MRRFGAVRPFLTEGKFCGIITDYTLRFRRIPHETKHFDSNRHLVAGGLPAAAPTHRRLAHAVYLRRPALGHALSGAAGQRPVHRPAVLAPVWSDRAHRPLLHRHPHRRWCVGRGQLLCPVLPGHPHPALGSLRPGHRRRCGGELPLYAHVADAGGRRPGGGPGCVPPSGETQGPPAPHRNAAAAAAGVPGGRAGLPPAPVPHRAAGAFRC